MILGSVGSWATSWVIPAVSPTVDAISWRITQAEGASSVNEHVRQAKSSWLFSLSSLGKRRFEHSEQKRNKIFLDCSEVGPGDADMVTFLEVKVE